MTQPHALNQPSMHKKLLRPVQFPKIMAHHFRALREWHLSATPFEAVNQTNSYTRKFMHCRVQSKIAFRGCGSSRKKKTQRAAKTKTFPARIFFHLISHINSAVCKASAKTAYEQQQKKSISIRSPHVLSCLHPATLFTEAWDAFAKCT